MSEYFKDHFSKQSTVYRKYRPDHPHELIEYLASLCTEHELAWDCATGNGQASTKLAEYFDAVYASDASTNQIDHAAGHPKITYTVERAEDVSLQDDSVDLLTVAVALHWFDFDEFYRQAKRVLKPGGIIAAWTYVLPMIDPETDAIIRDLHDNTLDGYWLPENELGLQEYETIPFPFTPVVIPKFYFRKMMDIDDVLGYLRSWSAVQRYIDRNDVDPLQETAASLRSLWNDGSSKEVVWRVIIKAGRHT